MEKSYSVWKVNLWLSLITLWALTKTFIDFGGVLMEILWMDVACFWERSSSMYYVCPSLNQSLSFLAFHRKFNKSYGTVLVLTHLLQCLQCRFSIWAIFLCYIVDYLSVFLPVFFFSLCLCISFFWHLLRAMDSLSLFSSSGGDKLLKTFLWYLYYMVAQNMLRTYGVNQEFRFVEGIWLHRHRGKIRFLFQKKTKLFIFILGENLFYLVLTKKIICEFVFWQSFSQIHIFLQLSICKILLIFFFMH